MAKLTIGKVAEACDVKIDTLRYYERVGLIEPERRTSSGYRVYHPECIRRVKFIKKTQGLGFSLEEIRSLLELRVSDTATAGDVLQATEDKIVEFKHKVIELETIRKVLEDLAAQCPGTGPVSDCPILDHLYPPQENLRDRK
ncbi:MAG: heavy metal-responsive transcriptional regulator [Rickettsiales bacterium]|nr:heavy metal-responsive transcriptional regulator [Rickettsiales bacterium]